MFFVPEFALLVIGNLDKKWGYDVRVIYTRIWQILVPNSNLTVSMPLIFAFSSRLRFAARIWIGIVPSRLALMSFILQTTSLHIPPAAAKGSNQDSSQTRSLEKLVELLTMCRSQSKRPSSIDPDLRDLNYWWTALRILLCTPPAVSADWSPGKISQKALHRFDQGKPRVLKLKIQGGQMFLLCDRLSVLYFIAKARITITCKGFRAATSRSSLWTRKTESLET